MKYPRLRIFKSAVGTHTHYIYRFKNESVDYPIEHYINNLEPVAVLSETSATHTEREIKNHLMTREDHPKNKAGYIAFSTNFDFIYSNNIITINLKNDLLAKATSYIKIYLGGTVISKLEFYEEGIKKDTITDPVKINKIIRINNSNSILIQPIYVNYDIITFDFKVRIIEFIDYGSPSIEAAHGVYDAKLTVLETSKYFSFYQDASTKKNIYHYRIITKSSSNAISELSRPVVCEVGESSDTVTTILESSDDFRSSGKPTWKVVESKSNDLDIRVLKENNQMASEIINVMWPHDIGCDNSLVASDGIRKVKVTNLWHKDNRKRMTREKKVFRAKNKKNDVVTKYSEPIVIEGEMEVLIDKMVILKKNVTSLTENERKAAIKLNDPLASTLKIYVRQGGRYFKDFFMNDFESNDNDFKDKPISSITLDSRFPLLDIKDSCVYSNIYNYTVYLYDEIGKISEPIVAVM